MYRIVKLAILGLTIAAPVNATIAAEKTPKLARCDGKSRRPANLYGSILPSVDPASGTVAPASARPGIDVFPQGDPATPKPRGSSATDGKPAPLIPPISALTPSSDYRSC